MRNPNMSEKSNAPSLHINPILSRIPLEQRPQPLASVRNLSSVGVVHDRHAQVLLHQDALDRMEAQNSVDPAMRWTESDPTLCSGI